MVMIDDALEMLKKRFENRDDLLNSVRNFAFTHGYAISINDSRRDRYVIIGCDRRGNYRNRGKLSDETRKRKTSSRLVNCPFEVVGKQKDGSWILEIVDVLHNHIPSINMSGHPSCRRLLPEEILHVKDMMKSGIPTRQILSSLRQNNPKLLATSQSVHNMKTKIFKELLDGRSIMQALLDEFGNGGFAYNVGYDVESRMTLLFFSHPASIALTRSYSNVFVMDFTYKTNKYKLPLLNIIGVSSFNTSFYSGFAYLKKEEEEDYVWALKMFANILGVNTTTKMTYCNM